MSVTYDQVLDGVVAQLQPLVALTGQPLTTTRFLHVAQRFMGSKFDIGEALKRGVAGRTPAVLVIFDGETVIRRTLGRKRERDQLSILVACVSDTRRSLDDRKVVLPMLRAVKQQLGGRKLGLDIHPLAYAGTVILAETADATAYAARFTTRYWADYTKDPGTGRMLAVDGQIVSGVPPLGEAPAAPPAPFLAVTGAPGTAWYAYDLQAHYAGSLSEFGPWASVSTAPDVLGGAAGITVSWAPMAGATAYSLRRRGGPAGVSLGVIYTGTATSFVDDGTVIGDGDIAPVHGVGLAETFA